MPKYATAVSDTSVNTCIVISCLAPNSVKSNANNDKFSKSAPTSTPTV